MRRFRFLGSVDLLLPPGRVGDATGNEDGGQRSPCDDQRRATVKRRFLFSSCSPTERTMAAILRAAVLRAQAIKCTGATQSASSSAREITGASGVPTHRASPGNPCVRARRSTRDRTAVARSRVRRACLEGASDGPSPRPVRRPSVQISASVPTRRGPSIASVATGRISTARRPSRNASSLSPETRVRQSEQRERGGVVRVLRDVAAAASRAAVNAVRVRSAVAAARATSASSQTRGVISPLGPGYSSPLEAREDRRRFVRAAVVERRADAREGRRAARIVAGRQRGRGWRGLPRSGPLPGKFALSSAGNNPPRTVGWRFPRRRCGPPPRRAAAGRRARVVR